MPCISEDYQLNTTIEVLFTGWRNMSPIRLTMVSKIHSEFKPFFKKKVRM